MKKLYIFNGPMAGQFFDLDDKTISMGRDSDNSIRLKDPSISRKHARISNKDDKFFIEDLYSQNGVWINGSPIEPGLPYEITEGVPIAIGRVYFSIGKKDIEDGMVIQCAIDLVEHCEGAQSPVYGNRYITDRKKLELIYEISMLLMQSLDIEEICEKIMDSLFQSLRRIDSGAIFLVNNETGELQEIISRKRDKENPSPVKFSKTIVHRVIQEGKAIMMSDIRQENQEDLSESIEIMRVKSIMCVPLISKSKILGVIYVHSIKTLYGFRRDDLFFFTALSNSAALAIENALLFAIHKRVVKALRESEEKYRLLVNNANEAIFIVQDHLITFTNPNTLTLLGYAQQELMNSPFKNLIHQNDQAAVYERLEKNLKDGQGSSNYSCRMLNKEGEELWIQINAVVINWEGKPATLNFARDLTRQRLLEDQLIQAHKMEAIHTLAGGISNDLNNLLMGIQGNTSLMLFDMSHENSNYNRLKEIERFINNGAVISEKLFSFTQSGKYLVQPNDINQIVSKTLTHFSTNRETVMIHENYKKDVITVEVDKRQIEQALFNIYANAWQAMPKGGDLYVSTDNVTFDEDYAKPFGLEGGHYVKISITDTGIGMDKQMQVRIFDPFFTTKTMGKGMGLGLATVYWIIKNHNGIVNVYSEKNKGTTFNIYLPIQPHSHSVALNSVEVTRLQGTETILVVDDNDGIVDVCRNMLRQLGYDVLTAASAKEIFNLVINAPDSSKTPKLVILDMIMPHMDSEAILEGLKTADPKIKVLLSSGHNLNGQVTALLKQGCDGFIQKPFNMEELAKRVRGILDKT